MFVFEGGSKSIELYKPIIFTEMLRKWSEKFEYHPPAVFLDLTTLNFPIMKLLIEGQQNNLRLRVVYTRENFCSLWVSCVSHYYAPEIDECISYLSYEFRS